MALTVGTCVGVLAGELLGLTLTGAWLGLFYRPQASDAFPELAPASGDPIVQEVHRWLAIALVPTLVVGFVLVMSLVVREGAARWRSVLLPSRFPATVGAMVTGSLMPWDNLALATVTVGPGVDGYEWIIGQEPTVRFAIVNGVEVSPWRMRALMGGHHLSSVALGAVAAFLAYRPRRSAGGGPKLPSA